MTYFLGKFLQAVAVAAPKRRTKIFDIYSVQGLRVGVVQWFSAWRRYNFFPDPRTSFDAICLREIADFCEKLMQERKAK